MMSTDQTHQTLSLDPEAARLLGEQSVVKDLDRSGLPHFLVKVPDLEKAAGAEVGIQIDREEDGCVALSVLLYDIPTEPVSYDLRLYPDQGEDLRFLRGFLEAAQFRLHPCEKAGEEWRVGTPQVFRLPANMLLRLKHYSLAWPQLDDATPAPAEAEEVVRPAARPRSPDPRDTVIRKLKEQVHTLRAQLQERDKRIIELEDEMHDLKSRGRSYRLSSEKKPWWKPF